MGSSKKRENFIGWIFTWIGILVLCIGIAAGFAILKNANFASLFGATNLRLMAIQTWIYSFLTGMIFLAIGEHLHLLQSIFEKN